MLNVRGTLRATVKLWTAGNGLSFQNFTLPSGSTMSGGSLDSFATALEMALRQARYRPEGESGACALVPDGTVVTLTISITADLAGTASGPHAVKPTDPDANWPDPLTFPPVSPSVGTSLPESQVVGDQEEGSPCNVCGSIMKCSGSGHKCPNCGHTTGYGQNPGTDGVKLTANVIEGLRNKDICPCCYRKTEKDDVAARCPQCGWTVMT